MSDCNCNDELRDSEMMGSLWTIYKALNNHIDILIQDDFFDTAEDMTDKLEDINREYYHKLHQLFSTRVGGNALTIKTAVKK